MLIFNVHFNHLGILVKYRPWFCRSGYFSTPQWSPCWWSVGCTWSSRRSDQAQGGDMKCWPFFCGNCQGTWPTFCIAGSWDLRGFLSVYQVHSQEEEKQGFLRKCPLEVTVSLIKDPGFGENAFVGNGNPLQYSCLENSVNRGAWWAAVHVATKSHTRLSAHAWMRAHTHRRNWEQSWGNDGSNRRCDWKIKIATWHGLSGRVNVSSPPFFFKVLFYQKQYFSPERILPSNLKKKSFQSSVLKMTIAFSNSQGDLWMIYRTAES